MVDIWRSLLIPSVMEWFKRTMGSAFVVNFYGELKSFIRWTTHLTPHSSALNNRNTLVASSLVSTCMAAMPSLPRLVWIQTSATAVTRKNHLARKKIIITEPWWEVWKTLLHELAWLDIFCSTLARHLHDTTLRHLSLVKRAFRNLESTQKDGLTFKVGYPITP